LRKINQESLLQAIEDILNEAQERNDKRKEQRKFIETVEVQIGLKGFDPARDKRINATTVLPQAPKTAYKFCLLGNEAQCKEAEEMGLPFKSVDELKGFKRNKKLVKKMAKEYDMFLASSTMIRQIPRLLGPTLNKVGKFPLPITPNEKVADKVQQMKCTIKGSLKFKTGMPMCLSFPVANCSHDAEEVRKNMVHLINYLTTQFKKGWQNIKKIHIKSTMGSAHKIYGF
jgi:large subunit ribosomal protein L10Ae